MLTSAFSSFGEHGLGDAGSQFRFLDERLGRGLFSLPDQLAVELEPSPPFVDYAKSLSGVQDAAFPEQRNADFFLRLWRAGS